MHCPFCFAVDTKVIDSRLVGEGSSVRRRRQCLVCNERFTTFEVAELVMPRVARVHPYAAVGSVWCVMNVSPPLKWRSWLCRVL